MDEPIRILIVLSRMVRNGAETMVMNLYRAMERDKIQFDFIVHSEKPGDYDEEIKSLGGLIYSAPRYNGRNHLEYVKWWKRFFRTHPQYKVIHSHMRSTASIILSIAKKYGLVTIIHSHSTSSGRGIAAILKNILQYPIRFIADYLVACSKDAGKWLYGARMCRNDRYFIIKNSIDCETYVFDEKTRNKKRLEFNIKDNYVVGHIGRFIETKNHRFLIEVFKLLHDAIPTAVLMLVGDGELRPKIENKVRELGLEDSVIFTGIRADVSELLQAMDIFLFPSIYEGLPVTLIEAQAASLPCIISDTISVQVKVTELIYTEALASGAKVWADKIMKLSTTGERRNTCEEITRAGYNTKYVAHELAIFYRNLVIDR